MSRVRVAEGRPPYYYLSFSRQMLIQSHACTLRETHTRNTENTEHGRGKRSLAGHLAAGHIYVSRCWSYIYVSRRHIYIDVWPHLLVIYIYRCVAPSRLSGGPTPALSGGPEGFNPRTCVRAPKNLEVRAPYTYIHARFRHIHAICSSPGYFKLALPLTGPIKRPNRAFYSSFLCIVYAHICNLVSLLSNATRISPIQCNALPPGERGAPESSF